MGIEVFRHGERFFVRKSTATKAISWVMKEGRWVNEPAALPEESASVSFAELPGDLREEMLAFVARAEALGDQVWSRSN
jgi:hypothetical protein